MMADVWSPLRYGWSHVYWLTVEGVPMTWTERALSKTVPTGYGTESATLVVDGSARIGATIERGAAIGAGFPLSFQLLDSASGISPFMVRPDVTTYLTSAHTSSATTLNVASSTGLTSPVYIGRELVTFTGSTATTLTGCTRGAAGLAYPQPKGTTVSSYIRSWRGRAVTLYAQPIDQTGYAPGAAWDTTSAAIWRGTIDAEPQRSADGTGWLFSALPLDRILSRKLAGSLTGEVTDLEPRFKVTLDHISLKLWKNGAAAAFLPIDVAPFAEAGYVYGDWISITEANAAIVASLNAAITASGVTWVTSVHVSTSKVNYLNAAKGDWLLWLDIPAGGNVTSITVDMDFFGITAPHWNHTFDNAGPTVATQRWLGVAWLWCPYESQASIGPMQTPPRVTVRLDSADAGTVPATGVLRIGDDAYSYTAVLQTPDASLVQFAGIKPLGSAQAIDKTIGASCEVVLADEGTLADVIRRAIHSSGQSGLRSATYDSLSGVVGYGLPEQIVDDDAIGKVIANDWLAILQCSVTLADQSLEDIISGIMALSGKALIVTDSADGTAAKLTAIDVSSVASGAAVSLTDAHVICYPDADIEQAQVSSPAAINAKLVQGGKDVYSIRSIDRARVSAEGAATVDYEIPTGDLDVARPAVSGWALSRIVGDAQASIMTLDVVPWVAIRPGDAVDLTLTHPALWTWSTGASGYTGRGRCIGREVDTNTAVQRLTLLIDGQAAAGANLCPATAVLVVDVPGAPTSIEVHADYYDIFATAYAQRGGTYMRLLYYEPGQGAETTTHYVDISSVTDGANCVMSVAAHSVGISVSTTVGWLTWPHSASDDAWQAQWMHDADGTRWV